MLRISCTIKKYKIFFEVIKMKKTSNKEHKLDEKQKAKELKKARKAAALAAKYQQM